MNSQASNKGGYGSAFWLNPDKITRLKAAFSKNANIVEACFYAGISRSSYYEYKQKNPDTVEVWENESLALRLKAKTNIADRIYEGNVPDSWKFLEKVDPDYAPNSERKFDTPEEDNIDLYNIIAEALNKSYGHGSPGEREMLERQKRGPSYSADDRPPPTPNWRSYQPIH